MTSGFLPVARTQAADVQAPVSIEAEQAVLGAILVNPDAYALVASILRAEHFSEEIHRRIFHVMSQLLQAGRAITFPSLIAYLGDNDLGAGVSTGRYLANLLSGTATVLLAPEHAKVVRDLATRRSMIAEAKELERRAIDAVVTYAPAQIASDSLDALRVLIEETPHDGSRFGLGEGASALIERLESIRRGDIVPQSFRTGFVDLDRVLGGLHPGTIVLVAARIAMGKTVVMTNIADGVARRNEGIGVLEFSLEIPSQELIARHLAGAAYDVDAPIHWSSILAATKLDDEEVERLVLAQRDFERLPISIQSPPRITAAELVGRVQIEKRSMAAKGIRLGVVLIDYLDKITATDRYVGQRTYEIQEIVTALKSVARSEDVCIVLLAQLNRAAENREDKRPSLADLKSSSFLEQEAHAVIFVYREAYYLLKSTEYRDEEPEAQLRLEEVRNDVDLIIGKNRSGPEATIKLWGDVACSYLASSAS